MGDAMGALRGIVERIKAAPPRIFVLGDAVIDLYVFGETKRMCPEAPVPIFSSLYHETRPGGAGNVGKHLEDMGITIDFSFAESFDLSVKERYMVGHHLVARIDKDLHHVPTDGDIQHMVEDLRAYTPHVLVISDYAKGWASQKMCAAAISEAAELGAVIIVDPKGVDWRKYQGASLMCPNETEVDAWIQSGALWPEGFSSPVWLHKLGAKGMRLSEAGKEVVFIPANARHVYDVTGAGDTVVAILAAAVGVGASWLEGARLANLAAGYVVGEVGTAVCPYEKLLELAILEDSKNV